MFHSNQTYNPTNRRDHAPTLKAIILLSVLVLTSGCATMGEGQGFLGLNSQQWQYIAHSVQSESQYQQNMWNQTIEQHNQGVRAANQSRMPTQQAYPVQTQPNFYDQQYQYYQQRALYGY